MCLSTYEYLYYNINQKSRIKIVAFIVPHIYVYKKKSIENVTSNCDVN